MTFKKYIYLKNESHYFIYLRRLLNLRPASNVKDLSGFLDSRDFYGKLLYVQFEAGNMNNCYGNDIKIQDKVYMDFILTL